MQYDKFLIAPISDGLQTDMAPWLISDSAYAELNNAYVWRGRLRKRFGSKYMGSSNDPLLAPLNSRLRTNINSANAAMVTNGAGHIAATVKGSIFQVGQAFSIGGVIFTVVNPAAGVQNMLRSDGSAEAATFNVTTGAFVIDIAALPATNVYFYPADPVMGLANYEVGAVNNQPSFAWDRQFAYTFNGAWIQSGTTVWHSSDSQFFWTTNYNGATDDTTALFVTNYRATAAPAATDDPMYYYDGTWHNFSTLTIFLTAGNYVQTARIIIPFKDRLLLLNTVEQDAAHTTNTFYTNRCRYSHNGSPIAVNAWLEPNQTTGGQTGDGAGFIDAPTEEAIISAEFIKDRLIVYFERSTWELAYTGNQIQPFIWQKLNTELGSEASFSTVPFDKVILSIGNSGVHACNGSNVERIDNKIPDKIFQIQNKREGVARVYGIRDYYTEMVYWTFPSITKGSDDTFPNRVLVYNYNTGTWAYNDDCITAFGSFEQQTDVTWASTNLTWAQYNATWTSGVQQSQFRQVIAGNQEGYVFIISADISRNAAVMQLTNVVGPGVVFPYLTPVECTATIVNHTLHSGDYFQVIDPINTTGIDQLIAQVKVVIDANTFTFDAPRFFAAYLGGGSVARVSNLFIQSKQWNPYVKQNQNVSIGKIDFAVKRTQNGEVTVDYSTSSTALSMIDESQITNTIVGNNVLETKPYAMYPIENEQATLWHRVYFQSDGTFVQITITYSDSQIRTPNIAFEDFWLEGLVLNTLPTSGPLQ